MKPKRELIVNFLTVILVLSLVSVSGPAQVKEVKIRTDAIGPGAGRSGPLLGKLVTRRNGVALVNGNHVGTGATVFSGMTLETPGEVRAVVQVNRSGSFQFWPNTTAVVEFNDRKMTGYLKQGCLMLTTTEGIEGVIVTPDGKSFRIDYAQNPSKQVCTNLPTEEIKPEKSGLLGLSPLWSWVLVATGGYMLVGSTLGILGRDCCDPSPSSPGCR
ncbi:MAG TPA: hypothetical protein VJ302_30865 [Blastocatellia bacterium]|nr:hypothetical protein [Blastocatellia bacterium]